MLDTLTKNVIKQAKNELNEGRCSPDEYSKNLNTIYQTMHDFNGISSEQFYQEVEGI